MPVAGEHPGGDPMRFKASGRFEGLARMKSGEWSSLHAGLTW